MLPLGVNGQLSLAVQTHQKALSLKPNNEIAHHNLALAYERRQDYDTSVQHAAIASRLEPHNPHP